MDKAGLTLQRATVEAAAAVRSLYTDYSEVKEKECVKAVSECAVYASLFLAALYDQIYGEPPETT